MLSPKRLGIAGGLVWGVGLFIVTIVHILTDYAGLWLQVIQSVYPGFDFATYFGAVIGLIYGFIDAFIGLYIFGWIYNKISD